MSNIVKNNRVRMTREKRILTIDKILSKKERQYDRPIESQSSWPANEKAQDIISLAAKEAKLLRENARADIVETVEKEKDKGYKKGHSEGYSVGYEEGLGEGREKGKLEYQTLIKEAKAIKDSYTKEHSELYKISEENMLKLSIDIAKRLVGNAIEKGPKAILEIAYNSLKAVKKQKTIKLKVSCKDFENVSENKDFLLSRLEGVEDIQVLKDEYLDRGSCIIDTGNGIIDGSVKTQISVIEASLLELAQRS